MQFSSQMDLGVQSRCSALQRLSRVLGALLRVTDCIVWFVDTFFYYVGWVLLVFDIYNLIQSVVR